MGEQTVTAAEVLHDSKSELQELGVRAERAAEACLPDATAADEPAE